MRFLLDADLPRSASETVRRRGHEAVDVRDVGLRDAPDSEIARYAQRERLSLVTADQRIPYQASHSPSLWLFRAPRVFPQGDTLDRFLARCYLAQNKGPRASSDQRRKSAPVDEDGGALCLWYTMGVSGSPKSKPSARGLGEGGGT